MWIDGSEFDDWWGQDVYDEEIRITEFDIDQGEKCGYIEGYKQYKLKSKSQCNDDNNKHPYICQSTCSVVKQEESNVDQ